MAHDKTGGSLTLRRAFPAVPPSQITQEPFDSDVKHLRRLARLQPGERAAPADLWNYAQDLLYSDEIQGPLLTYLLPFCLDAWRHDLTGVQSDYGGFVEWFYPALANKHIFDERLTPGQTIAVSEFMRESILEEIDNQRGLSYSGMGARPYRWITALTTHGVLLRDVDQLWMSWWSMDTIGKAVATVQYMSCLMYRENENPIFAPWTRDGGGGPPWLWGFGGHLYNHRWLEPNIVFLRKTLSPQRVEDSLSRAVATLDGLPEHETAAMVHGDVPLCTETLVVRCAELPRLLETTQERGKLLEWTR
jgi:hypothetical protein